MRRIPWTICLAICAAFASGCSGGGAPGASGNVFEGTYKAAFVRGISCALLVVVDKTGSATAVVSQDTAVIASGPGTVSPQGVFTAAITGPHAESVQLTGAFSGNERSRRATVNGTGSFTLSGLALTFVSPTANIFAGKYAGFGIPNGTAPSMVGFMLTVSPTGAITASRPAGIYAPSATGMVTRAGAFTLTQTGPGSIVNAAGNFCLNPDVSGGRGAIFPYTSVDTQNGSSSTGTGFVFSLVPPAVTPLASRCTTGIASYPSRQSSARRSDKVLPPVRRWAWAVCSASGVHRG